MHYRRILRNSRTKKMLWWIGNHAQTSQVKRRECDGTLDQIVLATSRVAGHVRRSAQATPTDEDKVSA